MIIDDNSKSYTSYFLMLINNDKPASNTSGPPSSRDCRDWFRWCHPTSSPTRRGEWNSAAMKKRWKNQGWTEQNMEKIDEHHGKPPKIKNGTSDWTYFCYIIELPNWFHTFRYLFRGFAILTYCMFSDGDSTSRWRTVISYDRMKLSTE